MEETFLCFKAEASLFLFPLEYVCHVIPARQEDCGSCLFLVEGIAPAFSVGEYECSFLALEEPRLLGVRESERLQGSIPELFGGSIVIKSAYASEERVISVMDVEATLENLLIYL